MKRLIACVALLCLSSIANAQDRPATDAEKAQAIEIVKAKLKDPDSAQFRDIKRMRDGNLCGWVNAKNSFGGYAGFAVFFTGAKGAALLTPQLSEPSLC